MMIDTTSQVQREVDEHTLKFTMNEIRDAIKECNFSKGMGHDSIEAVLRNYNSWVDHKPGLWTSTNVTGLPSGMPYKFTQIIPWVNPVPEADASVMAALGLAAVGVLVRRKAKAQAEALTAA